MVGLVAQDDAAGVAGYHGGDAHHPQEDRPGFPATGRGAGHGEYLEEGENVAGQERVQWFV